MYKLFSRASLQLLMRKHGTEIRKSCLVVHTGRTWLAVAEARYKHLCIPGPSLRRLLCPGGWVKNSLPPEAWQRPASKTFGWRNRAKPMCLCRREDILSSVIRTKGRSHGFWERRSRRPDSLPLVLHQNKHVCCCWGKHRVCFPRRLGGNVVAMGMGKSCLETITPEAQA